MIVDADPHRMCSALALAAAYALASGPSADTWQWDAPAECPSAAQVRADVERHLGAPLEELALAKWSVKGRVTQVDERGWELSLAIETPDGLDERTLIDPNDCEAVSQAGALLVALALDPEAFEPAPAPTPTPPPTVVRDDDIAAVETPPAPTPSASFPLAFVIGAAGGFDFGTLHRVSPMSKATIAWQLPNLRVGLGAMFGASPGFRVPPVSRDISLWLWTVAAEVGPVVRKGSFEFPLMIGIEAGQMTLRPRVLLDTTRRQVVWAAAVLTPSVAWVPRPYFALIGQVGTVISFVRPEFAIERVGRLHAPAPIGVRVTLGVEFRIALSTDRS